LLKTIERRTCYISLLLENPTALTHLVKFSNASPWILSFLTRYPVLLDELLDTRTLYAPLKKNELQTELRRRLGRLSPQDLEYQMDELRLFKQANTLRVAAADVTGAFPLMKVSDYLTDIAETVVDAVLELAWNHLIEKHGTPTCLPDLKTCDKGFVVIAYGKLGGIELGYGSDLDLVFLHAGAEGHTEGGKRPINNTEFFNRLGQRIIHFLTIHTPAGILYETDMRLRPSGISGVLVSHIEAFEEYYTQKAWTWEHQALLKARAISGDSHMARRFEEIRKKVLSLPRSRSGFREEIISMRERMRKEHSVSRPGIFDLKQDRGGIVDIEFLVQYLVLLHAHENTKLVGWTDNVRLLETLAEAKIIGGETAQLLKAAYLTCRSETHRLSLQEKPAIVPEDKFDELRRQVNTIWDFFFGNKPEK
jgi:glutamate-ammonia-ligase adenylyltransferase